jgi:glutamate racemase
LARIVIFDSGVGGLSIYDSLYARMPWLEILFVSDNLAYPYGTKEADELIPRVLELMQRVVETLHPDLIVIACNTASTLVLPTLREKFAVPFVGVVPAIKPAAQLSNSKVIGLLATPATISRRYTQNLIDQFAANCEVIKIGSSKLVEFAEAKLRGEEVNSDEIEQQLLPLLESKDCDILILACTHFPLLFNEIDQIVNFNNNYKRQQVMKIIDSGDAIARRVGQLIEEPEFKQVKSTNQSFTTRDISTQTKFITNLKQRSLSYNGVL